MLMTDVERVMTPVIPAIATANVENLKTAVPTMRTYVIRRRARGMSLGSYDRTVYLCMYVYCIASLI